MYMYNSIYIKTELNGQADPIEHRPRRFINQA